MGEIRKKKRRRMEHEQIEDVLSRQQKEFRRHVPRQGADTPPAPGDALCKSSGPVHSGPQQWFSNGTRRGPSARLGISRLLVRGSSLQTTRPETPRFAARSRGWLCRSGSLPMFGVIQDYTSKINVKKKK